MVTRQPVSESSVFVCLPVCVSALFVCACGCLCVYVYASLRKRWLSCRFLGQAPIWLNLAELQGQGAMLKNLPLCADVRDPLFCTVSFHSGILKVFQFSRMWTGSQFQNIPEETTSIHWVSPVSWQCTQSWGWGREDTQITYCSKAHSWTKTMPWKEQACVKGEYGVEEAQERLKSQFLTAPKLSLPTS